MVSLIEKNKRDIYIYNITKEKQQEVIQQLKDGKSTEDVDFLMFSTLLDYQPVTLSNMPVKYLEMPNGRVLYTLKTFTIKQLTHIAKMVLIIYNVELHLVIRN